MTATLIETPPTGDHFVCVLANGAQLLPYRRKWTEVPNWRFSSVLRVGIQEVMRQIHQLVFSTNATNSDQVTDLIVFRTWSDPFARPKMISELRKLRAQLVHIPPKDAKHHYANDDAIDDAIVIAGSQWVEAMQSRHKGARLSLVVIGVDAKKVGHLSFEGVNVFPLNVALNRESTSCKQLATGKVSPLMLAGSPWKPRANSQAST